MTTVADIYQGVQKIINEAIRAEIIAQGHHHTGAMEESLTAEASTKGNVAIMEGYAVLYAKFVDEGFQAESASYSQAPFLIKYFASKGYPVYSTSGNLTATQLAFMTINKWKKEGMPTQASKRFSKTGSRTNMIHSAFVANEDKIDGFMSNGLDIVVEDIFQKEKSETV